MPRLPALVILTLSVRPEFCRVLNNKSPAMLPVVDDVTRELNSPYCCSAPVLSTEVNRICGSSTSPPSTDEPPVKRSTSRYAPFAPEDEDVRRMPAREFVVAAALFAPMAELVRISNTPVADAGVDGVRIRAAPVLLPPVRFLEKASVAYPDDDWF